MTYLQRARLSKNSTVISEPAVNSWNWCHFGKVLANRSLGFDHIKITILTAELGYST